ncbi:hypothetical protein [Streptomyces sp. 3N207]|uniref:hypothetical protein n=1 Tax=Streptomyces sp. 3N207 TaxID=3457417 RepID=UPI003FD58B79
MTEQHVLAFAEFTKIARMALDPADLVAHVDSLLRGQDDGYMDQKPVCGLPEEQ